MGYVGYGTPDSIDRGTLAGQGGTLRSQADPGVAQYNPSMGGVPGTISQGGFFPDVSSLQGWQDLFGPILDASNASADAQMMRLIHQGGLSDLLSGRQADLANQEEGWGERGIGLSREQLGNQQNALARQMNLLPQQYELQKQGFDITQRGEQESTNLSAYRLNNQAAAAGAYTAAGTNVERTGLQQNLQNQFGQLDLQRQDAALTFQERQAQQQDAQKQLGIAAKRLDLSEEELRGRLQNTLSSLGIQHQISVDQLMAEAAKINEGRYSPIQSLIGVLMSQMNLPILVPKR
jgi:hypothetical protein